MKHYTINPRNPLLINMTNKVGVIDGAIDHCKRLMNNESIQLNGLHKLTISRGDITDSYFTSRIDELMLERLDLTKRISFLTPVN